MRRGRDTASRVPFQVDLWRLYNRFTVFIHFLFGGGLFTLTLLFCLLIEVTLEGVAVFEVPGTLTYWLVILKVALEVYTVGVDPLAC